MREGEDADGSRANAVQVIGYGVIQCGWRIEKMSKVGRDLCYTHLRYTLPTMYVGG